MSTTLPYGSCAATRLERCSQAPQATIQGIVMPVDVKTATDRLMRFLAVEGVTGKEAAIGRELSAALQESGVPATAIRLDDANTRIPVPTETGNLIVDLPGRGAMLNHPPITLLFCVREESGLWGARHVRTADLGSPAMAFNFDGGSASNVTIGAVGADRWQVEIFGRASHAGVAPERGISSTMILALALADVKAGGWFGKVVKRKLKGTSNVGPVTGGDGRPAGDATNVVTDYVHVRGESRSHDSKFFKEITKAYKAAFEKAAKSVKNSDGKSGRVKFKAETDYYPFRMKESLPVVKRAVAAVSGIGATPNIRAANGGLDANWMVRHGVPTVTFGAGQNEPHTIDEWINLDEYDRACALAVQVATMR